MTVKQQCGISKKELERRSAILVRKAWEVKHPNYPMPRGKATSPELNILMDIDMQGASISWGIYDARVRVRL